jgi:uncharacterized protein YcnI
MKKSLKSVGAVAIAICAGILLALAPAAAASAHVGLLENTAQAGSRALLTFTVPNESETLSTTQLTIQLPTDTPFTSVRPVALAGWDVEVVHETLPEPIEVGDTTITEAATSIVWTATDGGFGGEQMGLFSVRLGDIPDVESVELPAYQGYSDGSTVPWEGDDAPVLFVNAAPVDDHGAEGEHPDGEAPGATASAGVDVLARVFGIAGLAIGAAGVVIALLARRSVKA